MSNPKVSICIPYHQTEKTAFFLARLLKSIEDQTFKDYEIILTCDGLFAENHNASIKKAKGEIVKIMQMDDYFAHPGALETIVWAMDATKEGQWLISSTLHTDGSRHEPYWTDDIYTGNNRLGSVSSISFRREFGILFEEPLCWLVDCDWYYRMFLKYGQPIILSDPGVMVDVRTDRLSHTIPNEVKSAEITYLIQKYGNRK